VSVLVIGATGNVGREIVRALVDGDVSVRALVRGERELPAAVEQVRGDLTERGAIDAAVAGADTVAFIAPHHARQRDIGFDIVESCEAAGAQRLIYCSSWHPRPRSKLARAALLKLMGLVTPHYVPMLQVEERVVASKIPSVVLGPSNFFQNDELMRDEILDGVYFQPIGKGGDRVDLRDLGDAALRAHGGELSPGYYPILGPTELSGEESAAAWSAAIGREVRYDNDLEAWYARMEGRMSPTVREDFKKTYAMFQKYGPVKAKATERARSLEAVGHAPTPYEEYCARTLDRWRAE
jgi:uncharacterized protein YbjT (DUF2867 family)